MRPTSDKTMGKTLTVSQEKLKDSFQSVCVLLDKKMSATVDTSR